MIGLIIAAFVGMALTLTGGAASAHSSTAVLVAKKSSPKPKITIQPKSVTAVSGASAKFSVKAKSAKSYRWQYKKGKKWSDVAKATKSSYKVTAKSSLNGRQFRVRVRNSHGTVYSTTAKLTVKAAMGTRTNPYAIGTYFRSGDWGFKVRATDTDAWQEIQAENQFNDAPLPGYRYVTVSVTVYNKGRQSTPPWLGTNIEFLGNDGRIYDDFSGNQSCGVVPSDIFDVNDLYPGASATGTYCAVVPTNRISGGVWRAQGDFENYRTAPYKFARMF